MSTPDPSKSGWQPTVSTVGGALIGGAFAQLICALIPDFVHHALDPATINSITTLSVAVAGFCFPDGGRK